MPEGGLGEALAVVPGEAGAEEEEERAEEEGWRRGQASAFHH